MERLLNTNDVVLAMVPLILNSPFTRNDRGKVEKYIDNTWIEVKGVEAEKLTQMEAQMWLIVYNLCMDKSCREKYQLTDMRKTELIKLKRDMHNEALKDQLPVLTEFHRFLEELAFIESESNSAKSVLSFVEMVPEFREEILRGVEFDALAKRHLETHFSDDDEARRRDMKQLSDLYSIDNVEHMMAAPKCGVCGKDADQRCSKCKMEWYCGRRCQVKGWKKH